MVQKPKKPLRTRLQPVPLTGFGLFPDDWDTINFGSRLISVDDAPVAGAVWVSQLIDEYDFTYLDIDGWLSASAVDPNWEHAIYAGLDTKGDIYVIARNINL